MKIVDRATFLAMPAGTVFQKYEPCFFGPINVKDDSCGTNDFFEVCGIEQPDFVGCTGSESWFDTCTAMERGEPSPPLAFDVVSRDGLFDAEQLFAVWEPDDVRGLIACLAKAIEAGTAKTEGLGPKDESTVAESHSPVEPLYPRSAIEAAQIAARNDALDEAAQVADAEAGTWGPHSDADRAAENIAERIRALLTPLQQESEG